MYFQPGQRIIPATVLLLVAPVLALGPMLHVHGPGHSCADHAPAKTTPHTCQHHGHSHQASTAAQQPSTPLHHQGSQHGDHDCAICMVLAQAAQSPQAVAAPDNDSILTWSLVLVDDQCESASGPTLQARGPPA